MSTIKTASRTVTNTTGKAAKAKPIAPLFAGRGKEERATALLQVAPLAYAENVSRAASIANLDKAMGKEPTPEQIKAGRTEWIIGRVAARLPVSELPKGKTSLPDRLTMAREIVTERVAPRKEDAPPLRSGKIGERTATAHKIVRAAEEACSLIFAELGFSQARSLKEKNARQQAAAKAAAEAAAAEAAAKAAEAAALTAAGLDPDANATNAPSPAGSGKGKAKTVAPTPPAHTQLVKPTAPTTADDVVGYLSQLARLAKDWSNKYAKHCPVDAGLAAQRFHSDMLAAANALQERKAIAAAADKAKAAK